MIMKKKRLNEKLVLNKQTISNMELRIIKGGEVSVRLCRLSENHYTCPPGDYTIGCNSAEEPCFTEFCG